MRLVAAALAFLAVASVAQAAGTLTQDDGGRAVTLPAQVSRVFPAGPPASIDLFAVAPEKMLGWTRGTRPKDDSFVPTAAAALPELGRLTGRGTTVNLEDLVGLKPDLVLDVGTIGPTYVSLADRVQEQTGIPYVLLGGTLADTPTTLRKLGSVLGARARAESLAQAADTMLGEIARRVATVPDDKRPRVYLARGPKGLETPKAGSINGETLAFVGGHNVAEVPLAGGNLMNVSMEQVLLWQPEIIVTFDPTFFHDVWDDPLWQQVKAVTARRVYLAPRVPFPWIDEPPAVNRLIGVRWFAKLLYPDLFPEDMRVEVRRFYELFYQRAPTDAQLDALLAAAEPPR